MELGVKLHQDRGGLTMQCTNLESRRDDVRLQIESLENKLTELN
jgi:hypothetical protein